MKRLIALTALLLCLCVTAACDAQEVLDDVAQRLTTDSEAADTDADTAPAEAASGTDIQAAQEQEAEAEEDTGDAQEAQPASDTDLTAQEAAGALPEEDAGQADFTALSAEDCVSEETGLPQIVLECDGAAAINEAIENNFRYLVDDEECTLYYEYYKGAARILSVLMVQQYDGGVCYYTPYNLDLSTGQWISGEELLDILGLNASDIEEKELALMGEEFEYQYGGYKDGELASFYQEQYDRTTSTDNTDTNRLWLGNSGRLNFVAKIYAMAGAEYYEYPMSTGDSF